MAATDIATGFGKKMAGEILPPSKWVRNAGFVGLAVVFLPAAASAATVTAGTSASTAFVGTAAQQTVNTASTIGSALPGALSATFQGGTALVTSLADMPWSEMASAAKDVSAVTPAAP